MLEAVFAQYARFYLFGEGRLGRTVQYGSAVAKLPGKHRPDTVSLIITKLCNFTCPHCYNDSGKRHRAELSTEEKVALVDYLGRWGVPNLALSGGEPTLDPALPEVLRRARASRMRVKITTNAWHIPSAIYEQVATGTICQINVSLDGADAVTHDDFRGKRGSFSRVLANLHKLRQAGTPTLIINSCIGAGLIGQMEPLVRLALEHGCCGISFKAILYTGRPEGTDRQFILREHEMDLFQRERDRLRGLFGKAITIEGKLITDDVPGELLDDVTCNAGTSAMMIDADGGMLPCEIVAPFAAVPNLRRVSPLEAWVEEEAFNEFRYAKFGRAGGCGTRGCPGCTMGARSGNLVAAT
jgi:MoaA/NifB/PqqE/SkfB family radical SAM enzyme